MKSRVIVGTLATALFAKEFITINKLEFPYPYISQPNNKLYQNFKSHQLSFKKNTWILSFKYPQQFAEKFDDLADSDLILCETPKGDHVFKIVGAVSRNYSPFENGVSNYIPPGFVFLVDPVKKQVGMVLFGQNQENIAVITSKKHYSLGKFQAWWKKLNYGGKQQNKAQQLEGQSLQRQIIQRNNVRQQIQQGNDKQRENNNS